LTSVLTGSNALVLIEEVEELGGHLAILHNATLGLNFQAYTDPLEERCLLQNKTGQE